MLLLNLLMLGDACETLMAGVRKELNLAPLDIRILCLLGEFEVGYHGNVTSPSALARQLCRSEPAVVKQLRLLEERKLLRRHTGSGSDRRRTSYALSTAGGRVAAKLLEALGHIDDVVVALSSRHGEAGIEKLKEVFDQAQVAGLLHDPVLLAKAIPDRISAGRQNYPVLALAWKES